jgi:hypothetical protein
MCLKLRHPGLDCELRFYSFPVIRSIFLLHVMYNKIDRQIILVTIRKRIHIVY